MGYAKISPIRRPPASAEPRDGGQAAGVLHHVIIRGIERRRIFRDSNDQDDLLARLEDLIPRTNMSCYAWPLLSGIMNEIGNVNRGQPLTLDKMKCFVF